MGIINVARTTYTFITARPVFLSLGLVAFACLAAAEATAHPHVWIDARVEVKFQEEGQIRALDVTWTFDEIYSLFAVEGLDSNEDGNFESSELAPLVQKRWFGLFEQLSDCG